jgi:hypothetical protein
MHARGWAAYLEQLRSIFGREPPVDDAQQEADILIRRHGRSCFVVSSRGKRAVELTSAAIVAGANRASDGGLRVRKLAVWWTWRGNQKLSCADEVEAMMYWTGIMAVPLPCLSPHSATFTFSTRTRRWHFPWCTASKCNEVKSRTL